MVFNFANILVFILVGVGFIAAALFLSRLLQPSFPTYEKGLIYECGEVPVSSAWINYNLRYYLIAITFVVFDVEIAFVYPVATIFKKWVAEGKGITALIEILIFALILFVGLIYVWVKGDLKWFKDAEATQNKPVPEKATAI